MSNCSELVKIVQTDKKAQRAMFVRKLKEAQIRAIKKAAHDKRVKEAKKDLKITFQSEGKTGLSGKSLAAFKKYQQMASKLSKKSVVSQPEKDALELTKLDYLAIKNAKDEILVDILIEKVKTGTDENGFRGIIEHQTDAFQKIDIAIKKVEEFPADEEVEIEVEVAVSDVENLATAIRDFSEKKVIAVSDYKKLNDMAKACDEKKVYVKMYSETKQLLLQNDGGIEAEVYFETIEE